MTVGQAPAEGSCRPGSHCIEVRTRRLPRGERPAGAKGRGNGTSIREYSQRGLLERRSKQSILLSALAQAYRLKAQTAAQGNTMPIAQVDVRSEQSRSHSRANGGVNTVSGRALEA